MELGDFFGFPEEWYISIILPYLFCLAAFFETVSCRAFFRGVFIVFVVFIFHEQTLNFGIIKKTQKTKATKMRRKKCRHPKVCRQRRIESERFQKLIAFHGIFIPFLLFEFIFNDIVG